MEVREFDEILTRRSEAKLSRLISWFTKNRETRRNDSYLFTHTARLIKKRGRLCVSEMQADGVQGDIPWDDYKQITSGQVWRITEEPISKSQEVRKWMIEQEGQKKYGYGRLFGVSPRLALIGKLSPKLETRVAEMLHGHIDRRTGDVCSDWNNIIRIMLYNIGSDKHITPAQTHMAFKEWQKDELAIKVGEF